MLSTELGNERSNNVGRVKQNSFFYSLGNKHSECIMPDCRFHPARMKAILLIEATLARSIEK